MKNNLEDLKIIRNYILKIATTERANSNKWFFKTGPGEYGEGDKFLGITVPQTRNLAKAFNHLDLSLVEKLLQSEFHEERLLALVILIDKFEKEKSLKQKEEIFNLYFKNIKYINNWDLVDQSAPRIVGNFIKEKYSLKTKNCSGVKFLNSLVKDEYKFVKNQKEKLWEKRIGIVATLYLIMKSDKDEYASEIIFEVATKILNEKDQKKYSLNSHDLIQKATGWMLREYGKRVSEKKLKEFLDKNFSKIKNRRTLLRYAIERLAEKERKEYLNRD
jgi:3-methyladenine DNA glycosylase AlkD